MSVRLLAEPWWVNLLLAVPPLGYFSWKRGGGLALAPKQLLSSGVFAAAFGFVEAAVVAYLRAATGLLPGYQGTLADVMRRSGEFYQQSQAIDQFPPSLLTLELFREAATMVMLLSVAFLAAAKRAPVFWARESSSRPGAREAGFASKRCHVPPNTSLGRTALERGFPSCAGTAAGPRGFCHRGRRLQRALRGSVVSQAGAKKI